MADGGKGWMERRPESEGCKEGTQCMRAAGAGWARPAAANALVQGAGVAAGSSIGERDARQKRSTPPPPLLPAAPPAAGPLAGEGSRGRALAGAQRGARGPPLYLRSSFSKPHFPLPSRPVHCGGAKSGDATGGRAGA